jgi:hypothetical protein
MLFNDLGLAVRHHGSVTSAWRVISGTVHTATAYLSYIGISMAEIP